MKEETIKNRIDRNIEDLLVNMSIQECINNLKSIKDRFANKIESTENTGQAREKYIKIYIDHTSKRINNLHKTNSRKQFKLLLYKEKLTNKQYQPITTSQKYRKIALSES
jgi:hypothetical protein